MNQYYTARLLDLRLQDMSSPSPTIDFTTNPPSEDECYATTPERKYYRNSQWFAKRSLRSSEYWKGPYGLIIPRAGPQRIQNEAASLQYIASETNIPVPKVYASFEADGAFWLITERVDGVDLAELPEEKKVIVMKELERHLQTLRKLNSSVMGGPTGIVVPPYRLTHATKRDEWKLREGLAGEYVFCHNDLSQYNVIVDPETVKIKAIIDWEYAGFYPDFFEGRFYTRPGPSDALERFGEESDTARLLEFLEGRLVPE